MTQNRDRAFPLITLTWVLQTKISKNCQSERKLTEKFAISKYIILFALVRVPSVRWSQMISKFDLNSWALSSDERKFWVLQNPKRPKNWSLFVKPRRLCLGLHFCVGDARLLGSKISSDKRKLMAKRLCPSFCSTLLHKWEQKVHSRFSSQRIFCICERRQSSWSMRHKSRISFWPTFRAWGNGLLKAQGSRLWHIRQKHQNFSRHEQCYFVNFCIFSCFIFFSFVFFFFEGGFRLAHSMQK